MRLLIPLSFLFTALTVPFNANALDIQCAIDKYKNYASAQEQWQRALTDLTVKTNGNLKDIANMYLSDQLNYIEMNRIAVEFMLHRNPNKVRLDTSINQWLTIDSDDKSTIAKSSNRYAELLSLANATKQRLPHPDGEAIRTLMRDHILKMTEYQNLLAQFNTAVTKVNSKACGG